MANRTKCIRMASVMDSCFGVRPPQVQNCPCGKSTVGLTLALGICLAVCPSTGSCWRLRSSQVYNCLAVHCAPCLDGLCVCPPVSSCWHASAIGRQLPRCPLCALSRREPLQHPQGIRCHARPLQHRQAVGQLTAALHPGDLSVHIPFLDPPKHLSV
jgi:hypothetical protein